ncbi:BQ2448_555 [Microbotryum intermedium]|uniref:BQ2448_555 protein n=1 Tax=Microbotryum intermedium TaxID=269621 RepID=A0A238F981_9BASI|nr:BQ2448_555 [Microbotryum intermedium]
MSGVSQPFIIVPPLTTCTTAYVVVGDGKPPYRIYPIASGSGNATSLENVPEMASAGVFPWRVDFNQGANLTWVVVDDANRVGYSDFRVVRAQTSTGITTCSKTVYGSSSNSGRDAAIGGAVGGVVLLAAILVTYLVYRRYKKQRRLEEEFANLPQARESADSVEMSSPSGPAGVVRHGTFNLHHVQLNEGNTHDAPPSYVPPPPKRRFMGLRSSRPASRTNSVIGSEAEADAAATTTTPETAASTVAASEMEQQESPTVAAETEREEEHEVTPTPLRTSSPQRD